LTKTPFLVLSCCNWLCMHYKCWYYLVCCLRFKPRVWDHCARYKFIYCMYVCSWHMMRSK